MSDCQHLVIILRALRDNGAARIANQIDGRPDGEQQDKDDLVTQARDSVRSAALIRPRQFWVDHLELVMAQVLLWSHGHPLEQVRSNPDAWVTMAAQAATVRQENRSVPSRPGAPYIRRVLGDMPRFDWMNANLAIGNRRPGVGGPDKLELPGPIALGSASQP